MFFKCCHSFFLCTQFVTASHLCRHRRNNSIVLLRTGSFTKNNVRWHNILTSVQGKGYNAPMYQAVTVHYVSNGGNVRVVTNVSNKFQEVFASQCSSLTLTPSALPFRTSSTMNHITSMEKVQEVSPIEVWYRHVGCSLGKELQEKFCSNHPYFRFLLRSTHRCRYETVHEKSFTIRNISPWRNILLRSRWIHAPVRKNDVANRSVLDCRVRLFPHELCREFSHIVVCHDS